MPNLTVDSLRLTALAGVMVCAVWVDFRVRRIPNALILAGLLSGLLLTLWGWSVTRLMEYLSGAVVGLLAFQPLYLLRWVGAGDVKLLAVIGGFVGFPDVLWVALFALLSGGVLAWLWIAVAERAVPSPYRLMAIAVSAAVKAVGSSRANAVPERGVLLSEYPPLPYSLALAAGVVVWRWLVANAG